MLTGATLALVAMGGLFLLIYHIIPGRISGSVPKEMTIRMQILYGGCELVRMSIICSVIEVIICIIASSFVPWNIMILNIVISFLILGSLAIAGMARIIIISKQVGIGKKVLILLLWWVPFVNIILIYQVCKKARLECELETNICMMDAAREENQICKTKYPILMVHGIFFRDWQYFNYWGRIPAELVRNGATVYYGNQQSSLSIVESAKELSRQIQGIIEETGCGKVNIIAHSKGGLDSRYAISCLGSAQYVASLTTISTPHYGCAWVDNTIQKAPKPLIKWVEKRYNKVFHKLGDAAPDFMGGIRDLTVERAKEFNEKVLDQEGLLYQSVMSQMKKARSGRFPLNVSYRIIKKSQGSVNDGLVPIESAKWGSYLGILTASGTRGIGHGDMIDLNRENIAGFNVREFYVSLIAGLKEKGL